MCCLLFVLCSLLFVARWLAFARYCCLVARCCLLLLRCALLWFVVRACSSCVVLGTRNLSLFATVCWSALFVVDVRCLLFVV